MSITVTELDKLALIKKIDSDGKILLVACPSDFKVGTSARGSGLTVLGELQISGSAYFLKPVKFIGGLSGSLTQLVDGTPYIVAADGITATTGSSGQITLTADGSESPAAGSDNQVQFNNAGKLGASSNLWFGTSGLYVTGSAYISSDVGIGTTAPSWVFEVSSDSNDSRVAISQYTSTAAESPALYLSRARGTEASPTVVSDGDLVGWINFSAHDGTNFEQAATIKAEIDGSPADDATDMPGRLVFSTTTDGADVSTERMRINARGDVAIGTSSPDSRYQLLVNGDLSLHTGSYFRVGGTAVASFSGNEVSIGSSATSKTLALYSDVGKVLSIDAAGVVTFDVVPEEDTNDTVLILNSSNEIVRDEIDSRVWGTTLLDGTNGTNNELAIFTDSNSVEGDSDLTWDATTLAVAGNQTLITSNAGLTNDRALFVQNLETHCNIEIDAFKDADPNIILSENTGVKWSMGNNNADDNLRFRNASWASRAELTQDGDFQIDGDLTVTGNDIKNSADLTTITMNADGSITSPLQPAVYAFRNSTQDLNPDTGYETVIFNDEATTNGTAFDVGGDYNTATGVFTAPADGKYFISAEVMMTNTTTGDGYILLRCVTTNSAADSINQYAGRVNPNTFATEANYIQILGNWLVSMDSGHTAYVEIKNSVADSNTKIYGSTTTPYTRIQIIKVA